MIIFELTMPDAGSWNSKWSDANRKHYKSLKNCEVPKEIIGKNFFHRWDDGWCACVSVRKVSSLTSRELMKQSVGFAGYDWMIHSIIKHGDIRIEKEVNHDMCISAWLGRLNNE